jgi:hypothetical protein
MSPGYRLSLADELLGEQDLSGLLLGLLLMRRSPGQALRIPAGERAEA